MHYFKILSRDSLKKQNCFLKDKYDNSLTVGQWSVCSLSIALQFMKGLKIGEIVNKHPKSGSSRLF